MIRDWWKQLNASNTKVYLILVGAALLPVIGVYFLWRKVSYIHPGPAALMFGFAIVLGLLALWLKAEDQERRHEAERLGSELQREATRIAELKRELADRNRATPHLPTVIGVEKLAKHWLDFKAAPSGHSGAADALEPEESRQLFEQIYVAQCMYPTSPQLTFERCFPGRRPTKSALVVRPSVEILEVLKFDRVGGINKERMAYDRFIVQKLSTHSYGKPRVSEQPPDVSDDTSGAIAYEFAQKKGGSSVTTLAEYYLDADRAAVAEALEEILHIMAGWYDETRPERRVDLSGYDEYRRLRDKYGNMVKGFLEALWPNFGENLVNCDSAQSRFQLAVETGPPLDLANPLCWVNGMFGQDGKRLNSAIWRDLDRHLGEKVSAVHGDFHAGNILVERTPKGEILIWIIDFAKTHLGPTVQDIARLEVDVKFSLLPPPSLQKRGIGGLHEFENGLLPSYTKSRPMRNFVPPTTIEEGDFGKTLNVVRQLREAAHEQMPNDARVYQLALLHATLPILYYQDRTPWQKLYAFISAALLCERLGAPEASRPQAGGSAGTPSPVGNTP